MATRSFHSTRRQSTAGSGGFKTGRQTGNVIGKAGGVLETLHDADLFKQVSIQGGGRFVQWPGEIEFCADALWEALHTSSPRSPSGTTLRA